MKRTLALLVSISMLLFPAQGTTADDGYADGRTDAMSFWFDPDMGPGESFSSYYFKKQYRFVYKEAVIMESTNSTYFMINGINGDPNYPDFYGGVQQLANGERVAIFSAWDLGTSNCEYFSCKPDDADPKNRISLWSKGDRTTSQRGGGEGTFMQSFIYNLDWKIGQKISWLVALDPAGESSLLSAAVRLENQPWQFIATYVIPTRFKNGLGAGYGFIEDYGVNTPFTPRTMALGPTIAETSSGTRDVFTNVYLASSQGKNRHFVAVSGSAVVGGVGSGPRTDAQADYRVRIAPPVTIPDYSQGKALLEEAVKGKSTRYQEELKRLEEKAAADANAKAEAEAKAKVEAAKAAAEKAAADANAKAEAEAKAKVEAAKAAAEKAALEKAAARSSSAPPKRYANCAALQKFYPGGVALSSKSVNKGGKIKLKPTVNAKVYNLNKSLDRDKDGLACER